MGDDQKNAKVVAAAVRVVIGRNSRLDERKKIDHSDKLQKFRDSGSRINKIRNTPPPLILKQLRERGLSEGLEVLYKPGYGHVAQRVEVAEIDEAQWRIKLQGKDGKTKEVKGWHMGIHIILPSDSSYPTLLEELRKKEGKKALAKKEKV